MTKLAVPLDVIYSRKTRKPKPKFVKGRKQVKAKLKNFLTLSKLDLKETADTLDWISFLLKKVRCPSLLTKAQIDLIEMIGEFFIDLNDEIIALQLSIWSGDITKKLEEQGIFKKDIRDTIKEDEKV